MYTPLVPAGTPCPASGRKLAMRTVLDANEAAEDARETVPVVEDTVVTAPGGVAPRPMLARIRLAEFEW